MAPSRTSTGYARFSISAASGWRRRSINARTRCCYPLLDLTTTLDPYFTIAYRFGAIFLGEAYPGGPGRPDLAIALLKKGLATQPQKWQYMQDLGFVYYWHLQDYPTAASWFQQAAAIPGAPAWMSPLAAVTLAEGGRRSASRELWEQISKSEEPWLRDSAIQRLLQLDAMDAIDALDARVRDYRLKHPGAPLSWDALRAAGYVRGVPLDPTNTPYVFTPAGRVTIVPRVQAVAAARADPRARLQ